MMLKSKIALKIKNTLQFNWHCKQKHYNLFIVHIIFKMLKTLILKMYSLKKYYSYLNINTASRGSLRFQIREVSGIKQIQISYALKLSFFALVYLSVYILKWNKTDQALWFSSAVWDNFYHFHIPIAQNVNS